MKIWEYIVLLVHNIALETQLLPTDRVKVLQLLGK